MSTVPSVPTGGLQEATTQSWTQVVGMGKCPRCGGLMVADPIADLLESSSGHLDAVTRRCVQCGEVIDPIILRNRHQQRAVGTDASLGGPGFPQSPEGS